MSNVNIIRNKDGVPTVEVTLRRGVDGEDGFTYVTPDFTDRTSWYQNSIQLVDEPIIDVGDGLSFQAPEGKRHWVNINSEKLSVEYKKILLKNGTSVDFSYFIPIVKVNGNTQQTGFTVDYSNGKVTFNSQQSGNVVTISCNHNDISNASQFLLVPPSNKEFLIEHVELQFSKNLQFTNSIYLEVWAGKPDYDYNFSYEESVYYLQQKTRYRGHRDLINWCNNQYPIIPACGELQNDVLVFPFKYIVPAQIKNSQGVLIRLYLEDNTPLDGEIGSVTFYTMLRNEQI